MAGTSVVLQPRDRKLLSHLAILRVIDREQAKQLGPFTSTPRANARLLQLTRTKHLSRTFIGTISGGRKAVYFLPRLRPGRRHHADAFAHQLAINWIYLAFIQASVPVEWQRIETPLGLGNLIPDGLILCPGVPPMYVEVDRGTETLGVIEKKVSGYLSLALSDAQKPFRVLIITESERRLQNIRARVTRQTDKLFFFATRFTIQEAGPWAPVWFRPGQAAPVSLLPTPCDTAAPASTSPQGSPDSARAAEKAMIESSAPGSTEIPGEQTSVPPAARGT